MERHGEALHRSMPYLNFHFGKLALLGLRKDARGREEVGRQVRRLLIRFRDRRGRLGFTGGSGDGAKWVRDI